MCLSTPTTKQTSDDNSSVSTAACSASSPCVNGANVACNLTPKTQFDCNGNEKSTTISSITRRKTAQTTDINQNSIAKDLCDTLGYSEENAVYKEKQKTKEMQTANSAVTNDVQPAEFKPEIRWPDLAAQLFLHLGAFYGIYLLFSANSYTWIWSLMVLWASGIGITAGAHRLWSHKSYHASLPLRIFLIFLFTIAGQRDAYTWALDHRIHHKFSETEADPHNAKRGFWFAHVGWLFLTPHPMVAEKRKVIDMSDLENDKVVMFQRKWFIPLFAVISLGVPVLVPWYYWDESLWQSFWICFNLRFTSTLNVAFLVNSLAHLWGSKPYDKNISPVDSPLVSFLAFGEGWHNYHHVFPWDYKTGEFGIYRLNTTTAFIDLCARLGLATGRKFVSPDMIKRRALKCGDGSRFLSDEYAHKDQVWGFGDRDIPKDDLHELKRMNS